MAELRTQRLLLRHWVEADLEPFAELNADPEVMRYFPATLTREQSDELARYIIGTLGQEGWGLWAVEVIDGARFIGFVGLDAPAFAAHFTPAIEVGWRLARPFWGCGYASEAASAAVDFGFRSLGLAEIVSFTTAGNVRSRRVMERLGMTRDPADDFDHPRIPEGPLRRHLLYRLAAPSSA